MSNATAPEISIGTGFFFGILTFIAGILMGLHEPLWIQALIWTIAFCIMSSWFIRGLELGAMCYMIPFFFGTIGIIIGNISYIIQADVEVWNTIVGWFSIFSIK